MVLPTIQLLRVALISGLLLLLTPLAGLLVITPLIILVALKTGIRAATSITRTMKTAAARPMIVVKHVRILESLHNRTILPQASGQLLSSAMPWTGLI